MCIFLNLLCLYWMFYIFCDFVLFCSDCTNIEHSVGSRFLPLLQAENERQNLHFNLHIKQNKFDNKLITQCIAKAATNVIQEIRLDLRVHKRFFECCRQGWLQRMKKLQQFIDIDYTDQVT